MLVLDLSLNASIGFEEESSNPDEINSSGEVSRSAAGGDAITAGDDDYNADSAENEVSPELEEVV